MCLYSIHMEVVCVSMTYIWKFFVFLQFAYGSFMFLQFAYGSCMCFFN